MEKGPAEMAAASGIPPTGATMGASLVVFAPGTAPRGVLAAIRTVLDEAFEGAFTDEDWEHATGGWHVVVLLAGQVVSSAAVVARPVHTDAGSISAGYVEGVATVPGRQCCGFGSRVVAQVTRVVEREFEVGVLSTAHHAFYARLGWERWRGATFVRRGGALVRSADDDDALMVLRFGRSAELPLTGRIWCDERSGDDW